ncbi:MAG: hypothetical protein FWG29_05050, partial [Treponema sp.]|nr:hypothetical protein [Treponema sp.]
PCPFSVSLYRAIIGHGTSFVVLCRSFFLFVMRHWDFFCNFDMHVLYEFADKALYTAKRNGRNQAHVSSHAV